MRIANMIITLLFSIILGFQSLGLYSVGRAVSDRVTQGTGAIGIFATLILFVSMAVSLERPYISMRLQIIFSITAVFLGILADYPEMIFYGVIIFFWMLIFRSSISNDKELG